jgi:predicted signal transduction protein with EAL and GGDEF domain
VGASIGIAVADAVSVTADDLLKRADIALYAAKAGGRGLHRFFEPKMEAAAEQDQRLRAELREALSRDEFRVQYQPILDLGTSKVASFEALLRWQHPQRGLVGPAEFIALAETTGVIVEIGEWVLHQACSLASTWPQDVSVSVNLSPRQFRASGLVHTVEETLSTSGLPPKRLQLEITESLLLQEDDEVRQTIERLRALGVRISIDDFGTGYSSLGYLRRFAVDNIKIDRSFVADLASNPRTTAILQALIALARGLGISLTAEGIEAPWQVEQLRDLGCAQGQGYLFSRPMPPEVVGAFISTSWVGGLEAHLSPTTADLTSDRAA